MRCLLPTTLALGLWCLGPALPAQQSTALAGDGTWYRGLVGTYASLFPGGHATARQNTVVAVDVTRSDGGTERLLVPGSEGPGADLPPTLYVDSGSGHLFVLWSTTESQIFSTLQLVEHGAQGWSEPAELSGNPFAAKQGLSVLVTRDAGDVVDGNGAPQRVARTVAHVVWWEEGEGRGNVLYSPVTSLDGRYLGWNPVIDLAQLDAAIGGTSLPTSPLYRQPALSAGADAQRLVLTFLSPRTGRLVSFQVTVEPIALRLLADAVYADTLELFSTGGAAGQPIGDDVRAHIIRLGSAFHESVISYLADEAGRLANQLAVSQSGESPASLAGEVRAHIIRLGVTTLGNQILRGTPSPTWAIEPSSAENGPDGFLVLGAVRTGNLDLPANAPTSAPFVLSSPSGRSCILAWDGGTWLRYTVSAPEGWGEERQIAINSVLSREAAIALLAAEARSLD